MLAVLLQANRAGGPPNQAAVDAITAVATGVQCLSWVVSVIYLVLFVLTLITLMKTLELVSPRNRRMEPGLVWLNFVPCLNLVWIFLTFIRVADSLRDEFEDRGLRGGDGDFGKGLGITHAVLMIVCLGLVSPITIWMYRSRIEGYRRQLEDSEPRRRSRRDGYDDEDDRPRRRGDDRDDRDDPRDDDRV